MTTELKDLINALKLEKNEEKLRSIEVFKNYFSSFFKKYPARDIHKLCNISYEEVIYSYILINNPYHFEECLQKLKDYQGFLFTVNTMGRLITLLYYFDNEEFQKSVQAYNRLSIRKGLFLIDLERNGLFQEVPVDAFLDFADFFQQHSLIVEKLQPFFENITPADLLKAFQFYQNIDIMKKYLDLYQDVLDKLVPKMFQTQDYSVKAISQYSDYIYSSYTEVLRKVNKELKKIYQTNQELDQLIQLLDQEGEIKNIHSILSICPNLHIKELAVNYIVQVNQKYNEELWGQYQDLKMNSDENLARLFSQYGYDYMCYNEEERKRIKEKKYEQIKEILDLCQNYQIRISEKDFLNLTFEQLKEILTYLANGIFTTSFIEGNIQSLLSPDVFSLLQQNLEKLSHQGINMTNYHNSLEILFSDKIDDVFALLQQYGLAIKKETINLMFFLDSNLKEKIDFAIDSGYYDQLLLSLDLLNCSKKKLEMQKMTDQLNIQGLDSFLPFSSLSFFLQDEFIHPDYLPVLKSDRFYEHVFPALLNQYKINSYVMLVHNVFVSIPRFLSNLAKFQTINPDIILVSILYQGHYTLEEIENLVEGLLPGKDPYSLVRR